MQLQALFFDLDGTIANSMPYLYHSYQKIMQSYDVDVEKKDFLHLLTLSFEDALKYFSKKHTFTNPQIFFFEYLHLTETGYLDEVDIYEGAKTFIDVAKENHLKLFLVTNAKYQLADGFLKKHKLSDAFDGIITPVDPKLAKPNPYLYHRALEESKHHYKNVCAIEDSLAGLLAAKLANIPSILLDHHRIDLEEDFKKKLFQNFNNWQEALQWLHLLAKTPK